MPRRDVVAPENARAVEEFFELHIPVTVDAGVRRDAALIGADKLVDDLLAEVVREVENIIGHTEAVRHGARILHVVERTAGVRRGNPGVLIVIELHRTADTLVPRLYEKFGGDGGIHPAAHRDKNLHSFVSFTWFMMR